VELAVPRRAALRPLYPFGSGRSYKTFSITNLHDTSDWGFRLLRQQGQVRRRTGEIGVCAGDSSTLKQTFTVSG
jgi:hypothetical protein